MQASTLSVKEAREQALEPPLLRMQALVKEVKFFFFVFVCVQEVRRNVEETRRSIQVLSLPVQKYLLYWCKRTNTDT